MPRSFLLCGLGWDQLEVLIPDPTKRQEAETKLRADLKAVEKQFLDAGCEYEQVNYSPNEDLTRWEGIITSRKWDGIIVYVSVLPASIHLGMICWLRCSGGGIRGHYVELLENLINTIVANSPHSKILFNKTPGDTFDTAKRGFPDI